MFEITSRPLGFQHKLLGHSIRQTALVCFPQKATLTIKALVIAGVSSGQSEQLWGAEEDTQDLSGSAKGKLHWTHLKHCREDFIQDYCNRGERWNSTLNTTGAAGDL